ncbi:hypothetical protein [Hansschlegelia plantiphila]|uniref:Uncharacterized protein n=1 Tax=Hansschlegelia plantiphila TaxID=374655 RepID=A0A9W6MUJ9_9HYPH|nr:hypothetical protein [Hansschlegelia plantiphila]GLK66911.1 hypothetical protein GCM10008179_05490 [Hansschlegelia plantiphila]
MVYSVQQIKFEFLMYIKEFGGERSDWRVGVATDAPQALFNEQSVDEVSDIWLWKPALSPAAANTVLKYMTEQFRVPAAEGQGGGSSIYLYKRTTVAPSGV